MSAPSVAREGSPAGTALRDVIDVERVDMDSLAEFLYDSFYGSLNRLRWHELPPLLRAMWRKMVEGMLRDEAARQRA